MWCVVWGWVEGGRGGAGGSCSPSRHPVVDHTTWRTQGAWGNINDVSRARGGAELGLRGIELI